MEEIEQGSSRRVSPLARVALVCALVIGLVISAGAMRVDAWWRDRATAELIRAFDRTVTAIETGERQVQSIAESDDDMSNAGARQAAIVAAERVRQRRGALDSVLILPWHDELRAARLHAGTWLDLRSSGIFSKAAQGVAVYPPQGELDDARAALVGAFSTLK